MNFLQIYLGGTFGKDIFLLKFKLARFGKFLANSVGYKLLKFKATSLNLINLYFY